MWSEQFFCSSIRKVIWRVHKVGPTRMNGVWSVVVLQFASFFFSTENYAINAHLTSLQSQLEYRWVVLPSNLFNYAFWSQLHLCFHCIRSFYLLIFNSLHWKFEVCTIFKELPGIQTTVNMYKQPPPINCQTQGMLGRTTAGRREGLLRVRVQECVRQLGDCFRMRDESSTA